MVQRGHVPEERTDHTEEFGEIEAETYRCVRLADHQPEEVVHFWEEKQAERRGLVSVSP